MTELRRRQSVDTCQPHRRRRSLTQDRDVTSRLPRSGSVDRLGATYSQFDANIPPQFKLPLLDQSLPTGKPCELSVKG